MNIRKLLAVAAAALLPLSLSAVPAHAGNAHQLNEKYTDEVFIDMIPCVDGWFELTLSGRLVESHTVNANGEHFTFTDSGKVSAVPVEVTEWSEPEDHGDGVLHSHPIAGDPIEGPTWSGQYAIWGGGNLGARAENFTFTFNVTGVSSEGERLSGHFVEHYDASTPAGEVREHAFGQAVCNGEVERF